MADRSTAMGVGHEALDRGSRGSTLGVRLQPTTVREELREAIRPVRELLMDDDQALRRYRKKSAWEKTKAVLFAALPVLGVLSTYKPEWIMGDLIGGCTLASLAVPQDLAYAKLAYMPPVNGLYSSFAPPLLYAVFGSSRHIAVGPVSVVSTIVGNLATNYMNATVNDPSGKINPKTGKALKIPNQDYIDLVITATFFAGVIQFGLGFLRLGFVVDFLSHAAVVGFMAGAAVTISLGQIWGLVGYVNWTKKTDIVSIVEVIIANREQFNWRALVIGLCFLVYLLILKYSSQHYKKNKALFFINAFGPLTSVIIATACVYATRSDKKGLKTVGVITRGITPSSLHRIRFDDYFDSGGNKLGNFATDAVRVGVVAGLIALTEAVAIGRTFAAKEGYRISGNQEMMAFGAANLVGSLTSGYVVTGSFSRTAVNYFAGAKTVMSNVVMAVLVLFTLLFITPLFRYLPIAVLSAIIISALSSLVDVPTAIKIWKADKLDFVILLGTFFGVLFVSVEIGLLVAVVASLLRIFLQAARPHTVILGQVPGTTLYRNVAQYPEAETVNGILVLRLDTSIHFANANFLRDRLEILVEHYMDDEVSKVALQFVILDLTSVVDIDTTGLNALEDLYTALERRNVQLVICNPSRVVLVKVRSCSFAAEVSERWLFLSVHDAVKTCHTLLQTGEEVRRGAAHEINGLSHVSYC